MHPDDDLRNARELNRGKDRNKNNFLFVKHNFNKKYLNQSNIIVGYSKVVSIIIPLILSCFIIEYVLDTRSDFIIY